MNKSLRLLGLITLICSPALHLEAARHGFQQVANEHTDVPGALLYGLFSTGWLTGMLGLRQRCATGRGVVGRALVTLPLVTILLAAGADRHPALHHHGPRLAPQHGADLRGRCGHAVGARIANVGTVGDGVLWTFTPGHHAAGHPAGGTARCRIWLAHHAGVGALGRVAHRLVGSRTAGHACPGQLTGAPRWMWRGPTAASVDGVPARRTGDHIDSRPPQVIRFLSGHQPRSGRRVHPNRTEWDMS
jgi:hypothetical protein